MKSFATPLAMTLLTATLSVPSILSPACLAQTTTTAPTTAPASPAAPAAAPVAINCPPPVPAVDPAKKTWKHGDAEYND